MLNQDSDSIQFKVDHSTEVQMQPMQKRIDNLFSKDKVILEKDKKKIVIYGTMEQEKKSIYQIVAPHFWKVVQTTGEAAAVAGQGIYYWISTGATWMYDKFVNKVVPYAKEEIPRWFFVVKNGQSQKVKSEAFQVLQIDENDYLEMKKKQKMRKSHKKRVIISLDPNGDQQFAKFLQNQNYVRDTSFPIDMDDDDQEQALIVPSGTFMLVHNQVTQPKQEKLLQTQTQEIKLDDYQSLNNQLDNLSVLQNQVQQYKKAEKRVIKIKDAYIFDFDFKNKGKIEQQLYDGLKNDDRTQCGYLMSTQKMHRQSESSSGSNSGEVPLLTQKTVDNKLNVRVQIPLFLEQVNKKQVEKIEREVILQ